MRSGTYLTPGIFIVTIFSFLVGNCAFADPKINQTLTFSYYDEKTNLEIIETETSKHQVKLNGKIIHKDEGNLTLTLESFLPGWGMEGENIILLAEGSGGSGTGSTYRLIAVRSHGTTSYISESFGNGTVPTILNDYINQRITFRFPHERKNALLTWIYENGKIRKGK